MALFGGLDFGTATGLAYRHDFQADIRNRLAQEQVDRQTKIDAENKTKLFADELQTTSVSNPWDNTQLQKFYTKRFREIGQFVSENPDFRQDPELYIQYGNMTRGLLDNEFVQKSMRIETHRGNMNKWATETENLSPESRQFLNGKRKEYTNYVATGSSDGIAENKKEFIWTAPDEEVDFNQIAAKQARLLTTRPFSINIPGFFGSFEERVPDEMQRAEAEALWNDGKTGQHAKKEWNRAVQSGLVDKDSDPIEWIREKFVEPHTWHRRHNGSAVPKTTTDTAGRSRTGQVDIIDLIEGQMALDVNLATSADLSILGHDDDWDFFGLLGENSSVPYQPILSSPKTEFQKDPELIDISNMITTEGKLVPSGEKRRRAYFGGIGFAFVNKETNQLFWSDDTSESSRTSLKDDAVDSWQRGKLEKVPVEIILLHPDEDEDVHETRTYFRFIDITVPAIRAELNDRYKDINKQIDPVDIANKIQQGTMGNAFVKEGALSPNRLLIFRKGEWVPNR